MEPVILAVAGKGGVGKTSVAATMVRQLVRRHPTARILAIDADPAVGLATSLGIHAPRTVDEVRREIAAAGKDDPEKKRAIELLGESRYRLMDAVVEENGFAFLAIGRPEAAGCYCSVNAYLREVISTWAAGFDYVVIDGEAGIEQINRRVMEQVTHLLLITDPSKKGTQVVKTIRAVARELMMYRTCGVIVNRLGDDALRSVLDLGDIPVLAYIEEDPLLALSDVHGRSVLELPETAAVVRGVQRALLAMGIE